MRKLAILLSGFLLCTAGAAHADEYRHRARVATGDVGAMARTVRVAAHDAYRTTDLFLGSPTRLEARADRQLRDLEMAAIRFESALRRHDADSEAARLRFLTLQRQFCASADSLYNLNYYGRQGAYRPGYQYSAANRSSGAFNQAAAAMDGLMSYYGYDSCGALSRSGFGGRLPY